MTQIFNIEVKSPATHAFVIGVGGYPDAKPGRGSNADLRTVVDLPSAADSAKFMCRWLIENGDKLAAPLASLEVLVTEPDEAADRYSWDDLWDAGARPGMTSGPDLVEGATSALVKKAGEAWLERVNARPGDVALFYCCGHGASLSTEPVVFLADLNGDPNNEWTYVNLAGLGRSLRQNQTIGSAILLADACGETVAAFQLSDTQDLRFFPPAKFGRPSRSNVMLLTAAPDGLLAYDGPMPNSSVKLGRFTQILAKALDGASIRDSSRGWVVNSSGLRDDLKDLRQFYFPAWNDQAFEPNTVMGFNQPQAIVFPADPVVPVIIKTNPIEAVAAYSFCINADKVPDLNAPPTPPDLVRKVWRRVVAPSKTSVYAVAYNDDGVHAYPFTPNQPQFDLQVDLP